MTTGDVPGRGFQLAPEELDAQVTALTAIGEGTRGLVRTAGELAQRLPMLGTAPPALHLAMRLRAEAGESGLAGEVGTADTGVDEFHTALRRTVTGYRDREAEASRMLRAAAEDGS